MRLICKLLGCKFYPVERVKRLKEEHAAILATYECCRCGKSGYWFDLPSFNLKAAYARPLIEEIKYSKKELDIKNILE